MFYGMVLKRDVMSINLLPWRDKQKKKKLFYFILRLMLALSMFFVVIWGSILFQQQQNLLISQSTQKIEKLKLQINQARKDVLIYQKNAQDKLELEIMKSKFVIPLFVILKQIPFNEGELQSLHLTPEKLNLTGYATSQEEFDLLNSFFEQQEIVKNTKLEQFSVKNEFLFFEFNFFLLKK